MRYKFPYRWLPRTFFLNLNDLFWSIIYGVKNVIRWAPVIWRDHWCDWTYLGEIMEYKLRRDAKTYQKMGHLLNKNNNARQMLICAELLRRLIDEYPEQQLKIYNKYTCQMAENQMRYYEEYLFRLMRKHMREWWD